MMEIIFGHFFPEIKDNNCCCVRLNSQPADTGFGWKPPQLAACRAGWPVPAQQLGAFFQQLLSHPCRAGETGESNGQAGYGWEQSEVSGAVYSCQDDQPEKH